jgi:chromosome segregation ATPase
MKEEWGRVNSARDELAKEIAIYTKKFREMRAWENNMKQEVQDEKDRVTRRDLTIRQLQSVIGEKDGIILELQARCQAEVSKSADATGLRKTAEGRADELQGMLNEARSRLKDKTAQGFKDLLEGFQGMKMSCEQRTSDAMGVAQSKNTSLEAEVGRVKQAMLDATKAIGDEAARLKLLEEGMLPKAERIEASSRNIESVSTELQKLIQDRLEEAAAADRARDHRHQEDLASMRQQHADEAEESKAALEAAKDNIEDRQQQLDARQMCEQELSDARSKISTLEDMLVKSEQGRTHLAEAGGVGPSPERRHKRARGDTPRDQVALQSPPVSFVRRESGEMPEWHRAIAAADEVWHSFEPVILDDGVSHSWLLWYLSSVVEKEESTDKFLSFTQSEAQGWFCVSNVIQHGWTDPRSRRERACKRHGKKKCVGFRRVAGTTKVEFKIFLNNQ